MTIDANPPGARTAAPAACTVPPASADPAQAVEKTSRRGFLRAGGMLSLSSLMGTGTLMAASGDAKAAVEWAEHFQKNYRLMTDEEKAEARARLERRYSQEYGKQVSVDTTGPQPGVLMGYALNIRKCIGCRRCVHACVAENNQSRGERPGERIEWIQVLRMERGEFTEARMNQGYPEGLGIQVGGNAYTPAGQVLEGQYYYEPEKVPEKDATYMPIACMQCEKPPLLGTPVQPHQPGAAEGGDEPRDALPGQPPAHARRRREVPLVPSAHAPRPLPGLRRGVPGRRAQVRQPARPRKRGQQGAGAQERVPPEGRAQHVPEVLLLLRLRGPHHVDAIRDRLRALRRQGRAQVLRLDGHARA